jgi:hypothetical protein
MLLPGVTVGLWGLPFEVPSFILPTCMNTLWVKLDLDSPVKISTKDCRDVHDFLKACKKELSPLLDSVTISQLNLFSGTTTLRPGLSLLCVSSQLTFEPNSDLNPLTLKTSPSTILTRFHVSSGRITSYANQTTVQPYNSSTSLIQDPTLTQFWHSLACAEEKDGCVFFEARHKLLPPDMTHLYIRKSYVDLFNIIMTNVKAKCR